LRPSGDPDFCDVADRIWIVAFMGQASALGGGAGEGGRAGSHQPSPPPLPFLVPLQSATALTGDGSANGEGLLCYDAASCAARAAACPNCTTSAHLPDGVMLTGIASPFAESNPNLYKANAAVFPYCTSDLWLRDGAALAHALLRELFTPDPDPTYGNATLADADTIVLVLGPGLAAYAGDLVASVRRGGAAANATIVTVCDGCLIVAPATQPPPPAPRPPCTTDVDCPATSALPATWGAWNATPPAWCPAADWTCVTTAAMLPWLTTASLLHQAPLLVQAQLFSQPQLASWGLWPVPDDPALVAWIADEFATPTLALCRACSPDAGPARGVYTYCAACGGPPALSLASAWYHQRIRNENPYNFTSLQPASVAVPAFLDATRPGGLGPTAFGQWNDNCTLPGCSAGGCSPT
jgi:hypothetical protein